ncbi:Facilitated trehalose transporter Tret1 [Blattella germanica]|nr:Facilitated trehalose transporter Tret1 [Blattella germanica]
MKLVFRDDTMVSPSETTESVNASKPQSNKSTIWTQYAAAFIVNLVALNNGLLNSWSPTMLPILQSDDTPISNGPISKEEVSWVVSATALGSFLATPLYLFAIHRFSRKLTGYLVAVPFIVTWILIFAAKSFPALYVARLVSGMGSGASMVFPPIYISEIAQDSARGALGTLLTLMTDLGVLFGYIIGAYVHYYTYAYIAIVFPLLYLFCFIWLPETPMYLINKGDNDSAKRSLSWFRGGDELIDQEFVEIVLFFQKRNLEVESGTFKDIFTSTGNRRAFLIGLVLVINLSFCGEFVVLNYTVSILQESGTSLSPYSSSIAVGLLNFIGSFISTLLVDRVGRKFLLLASDISMAVSMAALGTYFFLKNEGVDLSMVSWLPVTCLSVCTFSFSFGMAPVFFVVLAEIFEPKLRTKATTLIISTLHILGFIVTKFHTNLSDLIGIHGNFWLFAGACILGSVYIIVAIPETKNMSYESILKEISGQKSSKKLVFQTKNID